MKDWQKIVKTLVSLFQKPTMICKTSCWRSMSITWNSLWGFGPITFDWTELICGATLQNIGGASSISKIRKITQVFLGDSKIPLHLMAIEKSWIFLPQKTIVAFVSSIYNWNGSSNLWFLLLLQVQFLLLL